MAKVEIYTWATCPFCLMAKGLLKKKNIDFIEHKIDGDASARAKMAERAGGKSSLPQIFINDKHIGGCDNLHSLEKKGKLDKLLENDYDDNGGLHPA